MSYKPGGLTKTVRWTYC